MQKETKRLVSLTLGDKVESKKERAVHAGGLVAERSIFF
jgi:hypothetical protein